MDFRNLTYYEEIKFGENDSLTKSSYDPMKPVIFIIHGFVSNFTTKFSQRVKNGMRKLSIIPFLFASRSGGSSFKSSSFLQLSKQWFIRLTKDVYTRSITYEIKCTLPLASVGSSFTQRSRGKRSGLSYSRTGRYDSKLTLVTM